MKVKKPGYYWATGPLLWASPNRQIVKVLKTLEHDDERPGALIVQIFGDTSAYPVGAFRRWIGPLNDPLLAEEEKKRSQEQDLHEQNVKEQVAAILDQTTKEAEEARQRELSGTHKVWNICEHCGREMIHTRLRGYTCPLGHTP